MLDDVIEPFADLKPHFVAALIALALLAAALGVRAPSAPRQRCAAERPLRHPVTRQAAGCPWPGRPLGRLPALVAASAVYAPLTSGMLVRTTPAPGEPPPDGLARARAIRFRVLIDRRLGKGVLAGTPN